MSRRGRSALPNLAHRTSPSRCSVVTPLSVVSPCHRSGPVRRVDGGRARRRVRLQRRLVVVEPHAGDVLLSHRRPTRSEMHEIADLEGWHVTTIGPWSDRVASYAAALPESRRLGSSTPAARAHAWTPRPLRPRSRISVSRLRRKIQVFVASGWPRTSRTVGHRPPRSRLRAPRGTRSGPRL